MSDTTSGLILFIRFDEVENGKVGDESGNDYDGALQGAPALVPDDMFGSCLHFTRDGDYVALPALQADFTNGLTIEAWANYAAFEKWSRIIDFRNAAGSEGLVFANEETTANLVLEIFANGALSTIKADGALNTGQWLHLAATVEAKGNATLYVNGQAVQSGQLALPSGATLSSNAIGKSNTDGDGYFRGKIASLRVYNRALEAEQIAKDMEADKAASASFRTVYPISFRLYDANDQAALYITDNPVGLPLNLELQNTSPYSIQLAAPETASASAANHHFQLRFRPGTLLDLAGITLKESGWNLQAETTPNGDSLYLLCTAARTLAVDEKIDLTLRHIRANGSGGAHGTRVELKYRQLNYAGATLALTGSRVQHMSIVNHSGEIVIPLHASFKGSQLVLNDGSSPNTLTLLIYNTSTTEAISWNPGDFQSATSSKFIISFEEQGSKPKDYALAETGQVEAIVIGDKVEGADWECHKQTQGESTEWIVTHSTKTSIAIDEVIELAISNIITKLPSGLTNLYLRYQNIPGYWDGQLIRVIEKAPLQYVGSNVGIGTATPRTALDLGAGLMSGAANDYLKAQFSLTGGGTVTWGGPGARLKWTQRFIALSMERPNTFAEGHVEINQPTTDLPATQVYDGQDRSANDQGIVLNAWESLYAVHEVGGNKLAVSFQIVHFETMDFFVPSNWILIAAVNMDNQTVKLGTGAIISANSSTAKGTGVPCGTIVMWYGDGNPLPDGWALCNGENGTPNLVDRFIVAAGNKYNRGDTGGADSVKLSAGNLPGHQHSGTTDLAGSHYHQSKLDTGSGGDSQSLMPTGGNNYRNEWFSTERTGDHSHTITVSSTNDPAPLEIQPPYYAVYFIMKLF